MSWSHSSARRIKHFNIGLQQQVKNKRKSSRNRTINICVDDEDCIQTFVDFIYNKKKVDVLFVL